MATSSVSELDFRPSYLAAGIVSALVFLLYLLTLAPSTAMWDASEYIAAAYTFGLPHPPGNPFFVLVGRVASVLPIAPNVAMRVNLLAAASSAVSAGMWFLITERVLVGWLSERWQRVVGGSLAAIIGATAFTVWNQSVVNEKVYTVSLVGIAIISWLMIRWSDDPDGPKADRLLVIVAYILGLGYANHMGGMLAAPAVAAAVLIRRPRTVFRWKLLLACGGVMVLGLTPFATQPIRAAHFPAVNEGEPTACRTEIGFRCTFSRETKEAFMYNFNRGQYGKPQLTERQAPFTAQVGMWWFYFKWQWLRDAHNERPGLQSFLAAAFLVLGLFGGWVHYKRDRRSFWYFGTLVFSTSLALIYYLNFKYGASQAPELGNAVAREVRDRDYFYLWSFSSWGVWASLGLVFIWESLAGLIGSEQVKVGKATEMLPRRRSWMFAAPVLALAIVPLFTNWSTASRSGHTYTRDFAHDLLNSVEPYGILITVGDNDTFPLWYAQEVEGIRRDVLVANTSLMNTDWYVRQMIRRPLFEYDAERGPAIYRDQTWARPTEPAVALTLDEADAIPPYTMIDRPMLFTSGRLTTTIDPRALEYGVLQKADVVTLRMIRDSWPGRPVYFSRTSGGYARSLGLTGYTLTQGLASKLFIPPAAPGRDTVAVPGDEWMDLPRTEALWNDVFLAPRALIARGDWVDRPSVGIPYLYVATGMQLADALRMRPDQGAAQRVFDTALGVARAVRLEDLLGMAVPDLPSDMLVPGGDTPRGIPVP